MLDTLRNKILGLAGLTVTTALLMGACPGLDILSSGLQPPAAKPAAPALQFTQPAARMIVQQGDVIPIQWTDSHPAGAATVQIFYDLDGVAGTGDEVTITTLTETAATTGGTYAWNTVGISPHYYRLGATISDQVNPPVTVYLPYELVVQVGGNQPPSSTGMSLDMLTPGTTVRVQTGVGVMLSWKAVDPSSSATLYLYYDPDINPGNGNEVLIAAVGPGTNQPGSSDYGWTIPVGLSGTFNILGRLHNGVDPDIYSYAPGVIQIGQATASDVRRDMARVGSDFAGAIFDGYVPYGHLGQVMTGGADLNADGYSDFMLVAPKALSQAGNSGIYNEGGVTGVGEAYLIYSRGASGRWAQGQSVSVGNIASYALAGVRFVGPAFTTTTSGFSDVMFLDDVDGDNRPEIVFGFSDINAAPILSDQQDYDPLDNDQIHDPNNANTIEGAAATKGRYYFQAPGWQIYSDTDDGIKNGIIYDALTQAPMAIGDLRTGLVTWITSKCIGAITNKTVAIDDIGQQLIWGSGPNIAKGLGMKIYPLDGLAVNSLPTGTGWGAKLGQTKLLGDRVPTVMIARPSNTNAGGAVNAGSIKVMPHNNMRAVTDNWTGPIGNVPGFLKAPKSFTFPAADTLELDGLNGSPDNDRVPRWPEDVRWGWFMDPIDLVWVGVDLRVYLMPPDPTHFDIVNQNVADATNGGMTNPTGLKDFDGDTIEDAAVASPGSNNNTGIGYIVYGNPSWFGADVSQFATVSGAAHGFELRGTQVGEQLGYKMAGAGNLVQDVGTGRSDWILTAPRRSWTGAGRNGCGAVIIVPGQANLLGSATVDDVLTRLGGAVIYGANANDHLGMYLAAVGDVDRDGYQDFVVSAPDYTDLALGRPKCGAVYLIYGGPHLRGEIDISNIGTPALPGKVYIGPGALAGGGIGPVAAAGDTDDDYYADFLIAQPTATVQGSIKEAGRVWLIYGSRRQAP